GGRGHDGTERLLPRGLQRRADGVRGGSAEIARSEFRRKRWLVARLLSCWGSESLPPSNSATWQPLEIMLDINNLHAGIDGKEILKGLTLHVGTGEVHAIMGPNGSGKSTLANVLAGRPKYEVTSGTVTYEGKDLLAMKPEDRAREGVFLAMQYPVEIPGVNNIYFLKAALNAIRKNRGEEELDAMEFLELAREKMKLVDLDESF